MSPMATDWEHRAEVEETAEAFLILGKRLSTYIDMLNAGLSLCNLANQMKSQQLHDQAQRIMRQFQRELEARPLFTIIEEDELQ